jgi:cyclase
MQIKRLIPQLLLRGKRLVKGTRFSDFVDVGDPVSQAMICDAQGAEEIVLVDIDATRRGSCIETEIITRIIQACRLPIAAGGGIRSVHDARKCFRAGADKIVVNTEAIRRPELVRELSREFGSQSVLVSVDVVRKPDGFFVVVESGTKEVANPLSDVIVSLVAAGAGELLVTSVDREGSMSGFDVELYQSYASRLPIPIIASGGAGTYDHIVSLFRETNCDGCCIGKMLCLRDYDIVKIKAYLTGRMVPVRDA